MSFNCGIVGLPNVGKSTLFNALTSTIKAEAANYPFCTIEPNKGIVSVPDERLKELAKIAKSQKIIPTQIEFIDIAGLVKGASKGEGLGNKFLSHIREVDAIAHVVRCYDDSDITHVEGSIDPLRDIEIIETELVIADLESVEKRIINAQKKMKSGNKELAEELEHLKIVYEYLKQGKLARDALGNELNEKALKKLDLITSKPLIYVLNVEEGSASSGNNYTKKVIEFLSSKKVRIIIISSKIEEEIASFDTPEEKIEFLKELGLEETGLSKVIRASYEVLGLLTFFTVGPQEARAWTVKKGALAPEAAGVIHTDFQKGFIRAETVGCSDYIKLGGESECKAQGKMRLEGKDYIVDDGDIIHFRFNV